MRSLPLLFIYFALLFLSCEPGQDSNKNELDSRSGQAVIYLVRHAEKQLAPEGETLNDPDLTAAGNRRAMQLAHTLGHEKIDRIYSTPFVRTQQTVAPLAKQLGLAVEQYEVGELNEFAEKLRKLGGRIVVSGHSDTTPNLVRLLGGDPNGPIRESWEYDRLFVLVITGNKTITLPLRYGDQPLQVN